MVPDYALIGEIMLEPQPWVCPKNGGEIQGLCNGEYYHRTWDTDGTDGFWSFFSFSLFSNKPHMPETGIRGCAGPHELQRYRFYAYGFTEAKVLAKKMAEAFGILSTSNWKSP